MTLTTSTCPECGHPVERPRVMFGDREMFAAAPCLCDRCADGYRERTDASRRDQAWEAMLMTRLPDQYHDARSDQVPAAFAFALRWEPDLHPGGIGLIGPPDAGKSMCLSCVVQVRRTPFLWLSGTKARERAENASRLDGERLLEARAQWDHALRVPLLVLDDISQGTMTAAWSSKLYDLLNERRDKRLPVLWSSQLDLPRLRAKIERQGGDSACADAISRRLAQQSLILSI